MIVQLIISYLVLTGYAAGKWSLPHCFSRCATGGASSSGHGGLMDDDHHHVENPRLIPPGNHPQIVVTPSARERIELTGVTSGEPVDLFTLIAPSETIEHGGEQAALLPIVHAPWGLFGYARLSYTRRGATGFTFYAGVDIDAHMLAQQFHAANLPLGNRWMTQFRMEIQVWEVRTRRSRSRNVRQIVSWSGAVPDRQNLDRRAFAWVDAAGRSEQETVPQMFMHPMLGPGQVYVSVRWRLTYEVGDEVPSWFWTPRDGFFNSNSGPVLGHPVHGTTVMGYPNTWPNLEDRRQITLPQNQDGSHPAPPPSAAS